LGGGLEGYKPPVLIVQQISTAPTLFVYPFLPHPKEKIDKLKDHNGKTLGKINPNNKRIFLISNYL